MQRRESHMLTPSRQHIDTRTYNPIYMQTVIQRHTHTHTHTHTHCVFHLLCFLQLSPPSLFLHYSPSLPAGVLLISPLLSTTILLSSPLLPPFLPPLLPPSPPLLPDRIIYQQSGCRQGGCCERSVAPGTPEAAQQSEHRNTPPPSHILPPPATTTCTPGSPGRGRQ